MKRKIYNYWSFLFVIILMALPMKGQGQGHDVYLTGNLSDITGQEGFLQAFEQLFTSSTNDFTLILNGDLVDHKITPEYSDIQLDRLYQYIDLVSKYEYGKMVLLTGDRDWNNNKKDGYDAVLTLEQKIEEYVKDKKYKNIHILADGGCPGPFDMELDVHLLLVSVNSQWWNHKFDKPAAAEAICKYSTNLDIIEELEDVIDDNYNMNILFVAHHPIKSMGNYGGRFSFADQFKPFPIIGSFVNAFRQNIGSLEDLSNEYIGPYIRKITNMMYFRSNIIMATSHEKNHQIMKLNQNYLVNSGGLSDLKYVGKDFTSILYENDPGFIKLKYEYDGSIDSEFYQFDKKNKTFVNKKSNLLYISACQPGVEKEEVDENLSYVTCQLIEELPTDVTKDLGKVEKVKAGPQYDLNGFKRFWMGNHYRDEWSTPIAIRYLDIDTTFNGLDAFEIGGGRQTTSLKFKSQEGEYFTFRSVDKDPSKTLDYRFRNSMIGEIFKDQTSAQHPYGALVISPLLDYIGILHVDPQLYLLPDVTALGPFQKQYGGMMGMLELNPGKANSRGDYFADADDILQSHQLFRNLYKEKSHQIEDKEYLRARIFDVMVGDWSRHENNWKWAKYELPYKTIYRPIPRDRDQVFSKWDGVLPSLADREWALPNTETFDYKIKGFKSLVYQARYIDRFLLTELEKSEYIAQAEYIQENITDANIDEAVLKLPPEVYKISGPEIAAKLKQRKKDLVGYAEKFYKWLNTEVEIQGSREGDYLEITAIPDTGVRVKIFDKLGEARGSHLLYSRTFYPSETKELRIYSLGGEDVFDVQGDFDTGIKINLLGGREEDVYLSNGKTRHIKVYDIDKKDQMMGEAYFDVIRHWDNKVYNYDRNRLQFDHYVPSVSLGYSSFNGMTAGVGVSWKKYRWDKREYASKHEVKISGSTEGNIGIKFYNKWKQVARKWDLISNISFFNPEYYNSFYGLGNTTIIDPSKDKRAYYVANYNQYSGTIGLSRKFWRHSYLDIETGIETVNNKAIESSIIDENAADILGAHRTLIMIPVRINLELDLLDHEVFPSHGIRTYLSLNNYYTTNSDIKEWHGYYEGSLEYYASTYNKKPFTLGLKVGGGTGTGNIPFYHQAVLGGNNGLRGYTSYRFTGTSKFYFNSEIRWELLRFDKALANRIGITLFYDMGRIYYEDDDATVNSKYHTGYGGGIYITPISRSFTLSIQLGFSDENSFYPEFNFGTALNSRF